jgi:transaldolase
MIAYFNVIWDEAEEIQRLAEISDPKMAIDTAGMVPEATELTNVLGREIAKLSPEDCRSIRDEVMRRAVKTKP